jgi:hypothetical protein
MVSDVPLTTVAHGSVVSARNNVIILLPKLAGKFFQFRVALLPSLH